MPWILKLSFVFAISGHSMDLGSTVHCRAIKACIEVNPWLARFEGPLAFSGAKMTVAGLSEIGVYELSKDHPKLAFWTNIAIGATFTGIAIRNGKQARKH